MGRAGSTGVADEAYDALPTPVFHVHNERLLYANPAALEMLEADASDDVVGRSIFDFVHPIDRVRIVTRLKRLENKARRYFGIEMLIRTCHGELRGVTVSAVAASPPAQGIIVVAMDVTRHRMKTYLRETERNIVRLFENTTDIYYRIDAEGKLLMASPAVERILGYRADELLGQDSSLFYADPNDRNALIEVLMRDKAIADYEVRLRGKQGQLVDVSVSSHALFDEEGNYIAVEGVIRDLTERKQLERRLRVLATADELTGIRNRRVFFEHAASALQRARRHRRPMVLMILDIDWFKRINDRFGHLGGDRALRAFAQTAGLELRDIDLFGRLGGEEFGVVLEDCPLGEARAVGERIRARVASLSLDMGEGVSLLMTVSIGATLSGQADARIEALLERADRALYLAKQSGRNRVQWDIPGPQPAGM
ncbi:GGDEF domain-containing protein [Acidihalobacter prosperus]|uniref:Diguanylate cyclase n=1 Tax=Acidihalobacter prosperus TaxID=160660 RepID=A0A1A6C828_9GAMM|nr:GGDEF domain-containing protein [Acidihalobacter prosperus]OBS10711.1 hypothetical protein Thpro_020427 [Acidihalobacter prosperus]